ncbi:hypothetical protein UFOVP855_51 [uncultured Caudovirales phage]|jgi:hypothetical protein|uniref:Uncharacterized protein n=1 Tax=uncultured Caudovirales phage TaxID=2100421 RepID=A0A6J5PQY1_9CAUD|nr:hypothetical protein UFOVP527_28 [uncultured Caudovirales phage]CAB4167798.1 hypothetical protein UFOVP855_51 [uncultured Caudovirales phage]CAB4173582.1 hypothetical protein UFOVP954_23 [uncultured Caudovirales phage]CAB4179178.1 hypothetical protein UFOVP1026_38 [uncultured Caudovirales phage]CAB4188427.1 hypothetical protein UFOVP1180_22 [uncultured Caudovirales phage]
MTKGYKPSFHDVSSENGIAKLKKDGFERHEVMGAIHNHTRGMDTKTKREFVRNFMKQQ